MNEEGKKTRKKGVFKEIINFLEAKKWGRKKNEPRKNEIWKEIRMEGNQKDGTKVRDEWEKNENEKS